MIYYILEFNDPGIGDIRSIFYVNENNKRVWVPEDRGNTDYQEYLAWLAEGNEPEVVES